MRKRANAASDEAEDAMFDQEPPALCDAESVQEETFRVSSKEMLIQSTQPSIWFRVLFILGLTDHRGYEV